MVQVPTYNNQEVKTRPIAQQGVTVQASAQDMGGDAARGMQELAGGIGNISNARAQLKQLENENIAKERHNDFLKSTIDLSYGENGYYSKRGKDAVTQRGDYNKLIEERRKEFAKGLTPEQASLFGRAAEATVISTLEGSAKHALSEHRTWFNDTTTARVETFMNAGLAAYQNPDDVNKYIAAAQMEIKGQGRMLGWDQATTRNAEMKAISNARSSVVMRHSQDDPLRASAYYQEFKDQITGEDQAKLEASLAPSVISAKAQNNAQAILSGGRFDYSDNKETAGSFGKTPARDFLFSRLVGHGASHVDNLNNNFVQNLSAMIHDAPPHISKGLGIFSGARSRERQKELFDAEVRKRGGVAGARKARLVGTPEGSNHVRGKAADLSFNGQSLARAPKDVIEWVHQNAGKYNMHFPMNYENWHIEPMGTRNTKAPSYIVAKSDDIGVRSAMRAQTEIAADLEKIKDPKERELTQAKVGAAMASQVRAFEDQQKASVSAYWELANQGLTPEQIRKQSPELAQAVGQQEELKVLKVQQDIAEFGAVKDNAELVYKLKKDAATNPDGFSRVSLLDYSDKISSATLKTLSDQQNNVIADRGKALQTGSFYKQTYDLVDEVSSLVFSKYDEEEASQKKLQLQEASKLALDNWTKQTPGKMPSYEERRQMIYGLVSIADVQNGGFFSRDKETPRFARDKHKVYDGQNPKVIFENIPPDYVQEIRTKIYTMRKKLRPNEIIQLQDITNEEIEKEWLKQIDDPQMENEKIQAQFEYGSGAK